MDPRATDKTRAAPTQTPALKPRPHPIMNFPLPRELRDEIYANLLAVERVEEVSEADKNTVRKDERPSEVDSMHFPRKEFRFTPAIMAVNREIGAEAQAYFHQHNRFVRVRFNIPGFKPLYHLIGLPTTSDVTNQRVESHCLSFEVDWPTTSTFGAKRTRRPRLPGDDSSVIIISLSDLPQLCDALGFLGVMELPSVPMVTSARGENLSVFCPGSDQTRSEQSPNRLQIRITAHSTSHSPGLATKDQKVVLECLEQLRPTSFDLSIVGFNHDSAAHDLKTSSSIVFPAAFLIDFINVQSRVKARIDSTLTADSSFNAFCQYTLLHHWCTHAWVSFAAELEAMTYAGHQALGECFWAIHVCAIEQLCSTIALTIFGSGDAGNLARSQLEEFELYEDIMTARMLSWFEHLANLLEIKAYEGKPLSEAHEDMTIIIDRLEDLPVKDKWIEHDIEVLREYFGGEEVSDETEWHTPLSLSDEVQPSHGVEEPDAANTDEQNGKSADEGKESSNLFDFTKIEESPESDDEIETPDMADVVNQLSIYTMPFRIYDAADDPDLPQIPHLRDCVGWEDRAHLAEFTKGDEAVVQGWQRKLGLPLSRFE